MSKVYDGPQVKAMFATATRWLEMNCEAINALNVFPVPDGDTGINMLFTMRAAMEEVEKGKGQDASSVAGALAWGALMGARGNSGVILSQILRGFSNGVEGESAIDGNSLARGLRQATTAAYKGVSKPVEGTILTVIKDASEAAHKASEESDDLEDVLAAAVDEARKSVERTPSLLPVLREAGVVDAGGQGLLVILEGALKALRNEPLVAPPQSQDTDAISRVSRAGAGVEEQGYGYCAQFLIQGEGLDPESVRQEIDQRGNSTVVVGAKDLIRVHTHTPQPEAVIAFAETLGTVTQVNVQDIDQQHSEILQKRVSEDVGAIAMVVVASGQGITELSELPASASMVKQVSGRRSALVCDDKAYIRRVIGKVLGQVGVEVVGEAETGIDAVERYKELTPDLVMMDIVMPGMTGLDAVRKIIEFDPAARILICSGLGQEALVAEAMRAGAKGYVLKPFTLSDLMEAVQLAL